MLWAIRKCGFFGSSHNHVSHLHAEPSSAWEYFATGKLVGSAGIPTEGMSMSLVFGATLVMGFKLHSQADPDPVCEACKAGKMHADPFPSFILQSLKSPPTCPQRCTWPCQGVTHQGYRYWVTFIDGFSCFKAVYHLKRKSETFAAFKQFKAWAENVTGAKQG